MTARYLAAVAAYWTAITTAALTPTWAASFLPITDPATASGVCIVAGAVGLLLADAWLPCPCQRKDGR